MTIPESKIRVLIIEDSPVVRQFLQHIISCDPRLQVAGAFETAEEALQVLHRMCPDVISMDIHLPGMNGFEATRKIMTAHPTPVVVVSASAGAENLQASMNALRAGALSVVEKPVGRTQADYEALTERLCTQLAIMSQVKVVRQWISRELAPGSKKAPLDMPPPRRTSLHAGPFRAVGIVASTGGPNALVKVLQSLSPQFPIPILLVQHITANFLPGFASWLDGVSPLRVRIASDGEVAEPGTVYVAPADRHLIFDGVIRLGCEEPVCAQRPSGTVLFQSMSESLGPGALGILLTGMGEDGATGLLKIRAEGGYTLAEHESTAVVYGMPGAAARIGAVCESLPLDEMGARLVELIAFDSGGTG